MKTLVIGYGNTLRGDDGVGPEVAERLAARAIDGAEVRTAVQPLIEWVNEWQGYDRIILIDAAWDGPLVSRERICPAREWTGEGGMHQLTLGALVALARVLYGQAPEVYRWRIRGESFDLGKPLTAAVSAAAAETVAEISRCLRETPVAEAPGWPQVVSLTGV
jgi:hydrogenase maturation protease